MKALHHTHMPSGRRCESTPAVSKWLFSGKAIGVAHIKVTLRYLLHYCMTLTYIQIHLPLPPHPPQLLRVPYFHPHQGARIQN